jgi:hypothetical protein
MFGAAGEAVGSRAADATAAFAAKTAIFWKAKRFLAAAAARDDNAIREGTSASAHVGGAAASVPLKGLAPARTAAVETTVGLRTLAADKDR